jgi:hypothetical protein
MAGNIYAGSADADAPAYRGWLLGHFMPPGDIRHSADVEIKWGVQVFDGVGHSWFAEEDSVIVGIRWPSVPGYSVPVQD